jgi:hypothetical protein
VQNIAMTYLIVSLYVAVLVFSLVVKTPVIKGPWLFLLRAFFPNWKFFHAAGHIPHLYARSATLSRTGEMRWSEWVWIYPRRQRRWFHVFHNFDTNLGLAQQNLVDHFWADLYDLPHGQDPRTLVTYQLVSRLVELTLDEQCPDRTHQQFELRMELSSRVQMIDSDVMMTSPITEWGGTS